MLSTTWIVNDSGNGEANRMVYLWAVRVDMSVGGCILIVFEEIGSEGLFGRGEIEDCSRVKGKEGEDI